MQAVCDSQGVFLGVNAKFPGSTHDSAIWQTSAIRRRMQQYNQFWLLGDSGYPLQPWLLTPYVEPQQEYERRFNLVHKKTRNCIERAFGVLKSTFRCLLKERTLHYEPSKAAQIIIAYDIRAHTEKVTCLDLGETGRVLVTGGQDRNVNLWAIGEEKCFMSLTSHNGTIECVKFAYNDDFVYSADDIGIIRRWDLNAQTMSSTLNGHMKGVRTLDFNPSGEYVVSGSNDTTVRLWDVRNQNKCIRNYRGHVSNINSVKFSPDGLWIASAGCEGSVIIWDVRQSKQIVQFTDRTSPVTCIQYHPYEFLLAAGRNNGSVYLYDLETSKLVSKTDNCKKFYGSSVKCITFSENGDCLFIGSPECLTIIGWEPDKEFDRIESSWNQLSDMKIINKKLICGSYDKEYVSVHALSVNRLFPFYNPSNIPFSHNQSSRKSFSRGNQKLQLSISPLKPQNVFMKENEENNQLIVEGIRPSPNLSIEMVEDVGRDSFSTQSNLFYNNYIPVDTKESDCNFSTFSNISRHPQNITLLQPNFVKSNEDSECSSSLKTASNVDVYFLNKIIKSNCINDVNVGLNESNPPILANYEEGNLEDFPVNNATPPDYAPKLDLLPIKQSVKQRTLSIGPSSLQIPKSKQALTTVNQSSGGGSQNRKLSNVASVSTIELQKVDNAVLSSGYGKQVAYMSRFKKTDLNTNNKENVSAKHSRNVTVQVITKPPSRSKTYFDLRNQSSQVQTAPTKITSYTTDDTSEIHLLVSYHEQVYQELSNRHATLQMIRNSTRSHDIVGALKQAIKISGRSVFIDILGAILEKSSTWNLDLCLLLLPEIYELLQSKHKFHYIRACDALRVILSNFLPIIQENIDPWPSTRYIGVDISGEERQHKCAECHQWLLRIRNLPDTQHMGSTLSQLQNIIVNI